MEETERTTQKTKTHLKQKKVSTNDDISYLLHGE